MMFKRVLTILLCFVILLSLIACGNEVNNQNETVDNNISANKNNNNSTNTTPLTDNVWEGLVAAESLFDGNTKELIKSLQGSFKHIENGGGDITFIANDNWYLPSMGEFNKVLELPKSANDFRYINSAVFGKSILCFENNTCYMIGDDGEYLCNDIVFNFQTDLFMHDSSSSVLSPTILSKNNNWYNVNLWRVEENSDGSYKQNSDGTYAFRLYDKKPLRSILTDSYDGIDIAGDVSEIFALNTDDGYVVAIITINGDLYYASHVMSGDVVEDEKTNKTVIVNYDLITTTKAPILTNVTKAFSHNLMLSQPIYIKGDDDMALYSAARGENIMDTSDDTVVKFIVPEGHNAYEVTKVFNAYKNVIFVFDNGDVYITDPISDDMFGLNVKSEITMTKCEVLSNVMKSGEVNQMCSANAMTFGQRIYILKKDGTLWAYNMSDYN